MTTPSPPGNVFLKSSGPPGSFLRQLLEEISGSSTSYRRNSECAPKPQPSPDCRIGQVSSVWVGGASIARDAREKLRAADESRPRKPPRESMDGSVGSQSSAPRLSSSQDPDILSATTRRRSRSAHSDPSIVTMVDGRVPNHAVCPKTISDAVLPQTRPTLHSLRIPSPRSYVSPIEYDADLLSTRSPLMFCDNDSNISLTPSPGEPATSAVSNESTEPSTAHESRPSSPRLSWSGSPDKRGRSPDDMPRLLSKKTRTMPLPIRDNLQHLVPSMEVSSPSNGAGGDNRCIVRTSTFIERTPMPSELYQSQTSILPELSSFRPEISSPQGLAPTTPVRTSTRRSSLTIPSPHYAPAETPTFARPFHLVDTDMSIYKTVHGEEWRENALCLHCFRLHGSFNRVLTHGYEVCGGEEVLRSHFWELADDPLRSRDGLVE